MLAAQPIADAPARAPSNTAASRSARIAAPPERGLDPGLGALELGRHFAQRVARVQEHACEPRRVFLRDPCVAHPLEVVTAALEEDLGALGAARQVVDERERVA